MATKLRYFFSLLALLADVNHAAAQGTTAFTYQGQLRDGGTNANGVYTMIFKLYDAVTNGTQIGATITNKPTLFNGLFSVNLDFGGGAFTGNPRWLDISITNGPTFETLFPRVPVLPSPYALYAAIAATVTNGAIGNAQLSANAVASTNIQNGAVNSAQLAFGAVSNANLAANAVGTVNIQDNAITTAKIADGAVMNRNLAANAVNATNIASGQVKSINGLTNDVILSLIGILTAGADTALFTNGVNLQVSALVPNMQVFTTNGTFTVPTNVTRIKVELWGGGGGGGKGNSSGWNGGGGGAGGYAFNNFNVLPGTNFPVTVGSGGTNGVAGTFSSFSNLVSATGGGAGTNAASTANGGGGVGGTTTNSIVSFGVAGATTNSIVLFAGSAGGAGGTIAGVGGNGASALGPIGGNGGLGGVTPDGTASGAGRNANGPGAGGGGGSAGQNPAAGGTGGPGLVIVYY